MVSTVCSYVLDSKNVLIGPQGMYIRSKFYKLVHNSGKHSLMYFVSKIVLTYCERQFIRTVKGQYIKFLKQNAFLTSSWRFLRSHTQVYFNNQKSNWKKIIAIQKPPVQESLFIWQLAVSNLMFGFAFYHVNAGNL